MGLMLFLFFILVVFNAIAAGAREHKQIQAKSPFQNVIDVPKVCPPHKWRHHEIKDKEGNTVAWKMACDVCGPLKPLDGPARSG